MSEPASVDSVPPATPEPVSILTPQDATAERIARGLTAEQAKAFRASRKAKKEKQKQPQAAPVTEPPAAVSTPDAPASPAPAATSETITFDAAAAEPAEAQAEDAPAPELSDDELSKLDEKARKRVTEASKEAAKVRKRAQEAEAKLKEHEARLMELQTKLTEAEKASGEAVTRSAGLAGNAFVHFNDAHAVATWAENAKDATALLNYHEREVKAGRRAEDEPVSHTLPNGQEVELKSGDLPLYQQRILDAQYWFQHDAQAGKVREAAAKLADKHAATKGYKEARESYFKDTSLTTRLEELVAKAALYDVLQSRRAVITFPDTAGAATKAPSPAEGAKSATSKEPPAESRASTPRLAAVNDSGSDLKARKSLLMEKARTAKTEDERQRFLKEAIKLGPMQRTVRAVA